MHRARAVLGFACLLISASAGASAVPLTNVQVDVDGDGRSDSVTVSIDGRIAVRRADGLSEALSLGELPRLAAAFVEVWPGVGGARYLRVEGRLPNSSKVLLVAALRGGRLAEIYNGPVGAIGRDGEYSIEVKLVGGELLRYETAPAVRRCDGETRLFIERYLEPGGWRPAPEVTLPISLSNAAAVLRAVASPKAALHELEGAAPLGVYRYAAASAQAGIDRADLLAPPRELDDGAKASAWQVRGDARGAFVTAQADGSGHAVTALRIEASIGKTPGAAGPGALPRKLFLVFEKAPALEVELLPGVATQWVLLPAPVPSRCLSIVIAEGADKPHGAAGSPAATTAIGELAIYSELDGAAGVPALVERVAKGDSVNAEGALRTLRSLLARQKGQAGAGSKQAEFFTAIAAGLGTAEGDGRRRLVELLVDTTAEELLQDKQLSERVLGLLAHAIEQSPPAAQTTLLPALVTAGALGKRALEGLARSTSAPPELRAQAVALLAGADAPGAVPVLLSLLVAEDPATPLSRALSAGLAKALRCRGEADPLVVAVKSQYPVGSANEGKSPGPTPERALRVAASLAQTLALALAGCPDDAALKERADFLAAAWPSSGTDDASFLLRYRLLQGLERLATATPTVVALLNRLLDAEPDPVLRQLAGRALMVLAVPQRGRGLADKDAGVRLSSLAALEGGLLVAAAQDNGLRSAVEERLSADGWPQVRRVAAEVRSAMCTPPAPVPALRRAAFDTDEQVQKQALIGLAHCEGADAVDVLSKVAAAADSVPAATRGLVCALLARHGLAAPSLPPRTREAIHRAADGVVLDLLQDPEADERHAGALSQCLRGLGDAGDATDLPALFEVAGSEVPAPLRQAALHGVATICGRGAALSPSLRKNIKGLVKSASGDSDASVQAEARRVATSCH